MTGCLRGYVDESWLRGDYSAILSTRDLFVAVSNGMVGILLAAGAGKRFGGDKCLARLPDGVPMAVRSAENLSTVVDEVLCVVRPEDEWLRGLLHKASFKTVICHDADEGMAASLRAGVDASQLASGWIVALADMPVIRHKTYQRMMLRLTDEHIVRPEFNGQAGHPVCFPMRFRDDLLALSGDEGAKGVIDKHPKQLHSFESMDQGVIQDFDTVEALDAYFAQNHSLAFLLGQT